MDPDNELSMNPGPRDPSVLHLQSVHRSTTVWAAGGGDTQRSRKRNPTQTRFPQLHQRMIPLLSDLRFDGVSRLCSINIDWSLITALVERWRPETHSFHLPVGECTITLQDVSLLLGLRVDGDAVIGITAVDGGWDHIIKEIFGQSPGNQLVGGRLKLSWLTKCFPSLSDNASDLELRRYTQSYLLQLIAGVLFTDKSGGMIHCMYIPLIRDFQVCRTLAWGAAVLCNLYREMCKSCRITTEENAGCLLLLQLWAWTRFPTIAPIPRGPSLDNSNIWGSQSGPYGMRWCSQLNFGETSAHVVSTHRLALDGLAPSHFIWQPYSEFLFTAPEHLIDGTSLWCYKGPLICFYIVEPHLPNRCMRQFGFIQDIPTMEGYDLYSKHLHDINLQGKQDTNWIITHRDYISHWVSRAEHVIGVGANLGVGVVDGYDQWYTNITRLYHTRVGGSHLFAIHLLNQISMVARGEIDGDMSYVDFIATNGRKLIEDQFNQGVFQDFPVEERRQKEIELKPKTKKTGHKGGRGRVNAPRRPGKQCADVGDRGVCLDDEGSFYMGDGVAVPLGDKGGNVGDNLNHVHEDRAGQIDSDARVPKPRDEYPRWNLLPSDDSMYNATQTAANQSSPTHQQAGIYDSMYNAGLLLLIEEDMEMTSKVNKGMKEEDVEMTSELNRRIKEAVDKFSEGEWTEILMRLPVKSILRFRCASKLFLSIISSPHFHRSHLDCAMKRANNDFTLIAHVNELDEDNHTITLFELGSCTVTSNLGFPYSQGQFPSDHEPILVGSACGIACVFVNIPNYPAPPLNYIYLWNPLTKCSKLVPPPIIDRIDERRIALGFGYNSTDGDLKILRIVQKDKEDVITSTFSGEVYSMRSDAWHKIADPFTISHNFNFECLHGYMLATQVCNGFMAFNICTEVLTCNIQLPAGANSPYPCFEARFADRKGSVVVVMCMSNLNVMDFGRVMNNEIRLWTLDNEACLHDGGVQASWIPLLIYTYDLPINFLGSLFNDDELLVGTELEGEMRCCFINPNDGVVRFVGPEHYFQPDEVFKFSESLISIPGSEPVNWSSSSTKSGVKLVDYSSDSKDVEK